MQELEKILEEIREYENHVCNEVKIVGYIAGAKRVIRGVEEIIRKHMNDGWIPVSERLPEKDGFYITTMDGEVVGQEESFVGLAEFENGKWIDDEEDYKCVIAWRPLPDPYRPERSNGE